jgi:hypothetical protein
MSAGPKKSTVWLATVSTLVGVATGMVTLREKVLPGDNQANASTGDFERAMDPICDALNVSETERPRDVRHLRRALQKATTNTEQRDAIMVSTRRTRSDSSRQLAKFRGLDVPEKLAEQHEKTGDAWARNVDRLRRYESRLDAVEDRGDLVHELRSFSRKKYVMGRDGDTRDMGLERLSNSSCLDEAEVTPPVPLPRLDTETDQPPGSGSTGTPNAQPDTGPDVDAMPDATPPPDDGTEPDASPPPPPPPPDGASPPPGSD